LLTAAVLIETLSAPEVNNLFMSSKLLTPPPTVSGTKQFLDVLLITSNIVSLFSFEAVIY